MNYSKTLPLLCALFMSLSLVSAHANDKPPSPPPKPVDETPLQLQLQGQLQGQQQGQHQGQNQGQLQGQETKVDTTAISGSLSGAKSNSAADSKSNAASDAHSNSKSNSQATGGAATVKDAGNAKSTSGSFSSSGVDGSGNSQNAQKTGVNVDASDRSGGDSFTDQSKVLFIPPVVPATPPSYVGNAQIVKETSACGPLQSIVRTPVAGTFYGVFTTDRTEQGWTEDLAPYVDAQGQQQEYLMRDGFGGKVFYGHQVTMFTTVVGVANARNVAIGGGGSGGSWGQGGTGTSAANQQMVTTIKLRLCEAGRIAPTPAVIPTAPPQEPIRPMPTVSKVGE